MQKVAVVTDSTCDIPPSIVSELDLHVVPLTVSIDGTPMLDDDSYQREMLHEKIVSAQRASTSQPSPGQFATVYEQLKRKGLHIISVHVSSLLSGTVQSATIAKQMIDERIEIVDSKTSSLAMGLGIIEACKAARLGWGKDEVLKKLTTCLEQTKALFTVGSLHHLHKIGRLGKLQAMIGSFLGLKPILHITEGEISLKERSRAATLTSRLLDLIDNNIDSRHPVTFGICHIDSEKFATELKHKLESLYECQQFLVTRAGATMAAAVGPGSVGVFHMQECST